MAADLRDRGQQGSTSGGRHVVQTILHGGRAERAGPASPACGPAVALEGTGMGPAQDRTF